MNEIEQLTVDMDQQGGLDDGSGEEGELVKSVRFMRPALPCLGAWSTTRTAYATSLELDSLSPGKVRRCLLGLLIVDEAFAVPGACMHSGTSSRCLLPFQAPSWHPHRRRL